MSIRIAHLSDIHFGGEQKDAVEAAIAAVAAFEPTLTAVSGDLTLNGRQAEFTQARAWLDRLPESRIITPGNHDTPYWNPLLRAVSPFARYRRHIGDPETAAFDAPGLVARSVNSARGAQFRLNWSEGAISIAKLRALDWAEASDQPLRVFVCHHPLIDLEFAPVMGGVHGGEAAAAILVQSGVELILTGHVHNPFVLPLSFAKERCFAIGAGTLSKRTRGSPPSFTTIVADQSVFDVAVQSWSGERFVAAQSWRLARPHAAEGNGSAAPPERGRRDAPS